MINKEQAGMQPVIFFRGKTTGGPWTEVTDPQTMAHLAQSYEDGLYEYRTFYTAAVNPAAEDWNNPDNVAVDRFAAALKTEMAAARSKGWRGWAAHAHCSTAELQDMLMGRVAKGETLQIGVFAAMLWNRGELTAAAALLETDEGADQAQDGAA